MKKIILIIVMLLITQVIYSQKRSVKAEQLFITNKISGKSVKIGASEATLKNFGELIKVDTMYTVYERNGKKVKDINNSDNFLRYTFKGVVFYINEQHKISSFYARSKDMVLEKKGMFSISPGDQLSEIAKLFPDETEEAFKHTWGEDNRLYSTVFIQLSGYIPSVKEYMDIDVKIGLLFNPDTNILEEIFYWIRP